MVHCNKTFSFTLWNNCKEIYISGIVERKKEKRKSDIVVNY